MRALRIHRYGALADVELNEVPVPTGGPDEVVLRVRAASTNPIDVRLLRGERQNVYPLQFPYSLGLDVAGDVVAVGAQVTHLAPGDRVVARLDAQRGGAFAEVAVAKGRLTVRLPDGVSYEAAAALPTAGGTAVEAVEDVAHLGPGRSVLIHAAAGGVGTFAVQAAKGAGARVLATASAQKLALVRELGADEVIDYRREDFTQRVKDVDVVLDAVGGQTQASSFGVLREGGLLISVTTPPDLALAAARGVKALRLTHAATGQRLERMVGWVAAGQWRVVFDRVVPFSSWREALEATAQGHATGKIVLLGPTP